MFAGAEATETRSGTAKPVAPLLQQDTFTFAPESHAIPPMSIIAGSFLNSLLRREPQGPSEAAEGDSDDDGEGSDADGGGNQRGDEDEGDAGGDAKEEPAPADDEAPKAAAAGPGAVSQSALDSFGEDSDYFRSMLSFFSTELNKQPATQPQQESSEESSESESDDDSDDDSEEEEETKERARPATRRSARARR